MKKRLFMILIILLFTISCVGCNDLNVNLNEHDYQINLEAITIFAAENEATIISSEPITLNPSSVSSRRVGGIGATQDAKKFTLNTYDDNGVTVYSFDVEDPAYRQAALEYINQLTGDLAQGRPALRGVLFPGQSEYYKDAQYDGSAMSYAWKRNTASTWITILKVVNLPCGEEAEALAILY